MWQIKYNNEFFDITPGDNPEVERNSPLFLIDNILQEVSTPFTLADTDKNNRLIGHYFFELTNKARKQIDVEVYMFGSYKNNASMVIEGAGMNAVINGKGSVTGYLKFGISNLFAAIKDKKLSELVLGGDRVFSHTTDDPLDASDGYWQHAQAAYDFTYDYVFLPYKNLAFTDDDFEFSSFQWGNKFDGEKISIGQPIVPWTKLEYVLTQIFAEHGWKLDTTGLNDTEWQKLLLYSNYTISTSDFTLSGSSLLPSPKGTITINLAKAMPPDITCSTFLFEICKRYLWAPICDITTNTCRLIALKNMVNAPVKDWTKYASPVLSSEFTIDERIFAFKNTFNDDDSYPSAPDLTQYPTIGFAQTKKLLIPADLISNNLLYYTFLENKWYKNTYDGSAIDWVEFGDNIYNEDPGNATDTFETAVTTLPLMRAQFEGGQYGLFPVVNQEKNSKWGIRTVLYHGMVKQVDEDGSPLDITYPYGSSTNMPPAQEPTLTWSNVYKHSNYLSDYGIIEYWAKKWMQLISNTEEITRRIALPLHELVNFKWDNLILINNIAYLVKSFVQPLAYSDFIEAKLQRANLVANPENIIPIDSSDAHFDYLTVLSQDLYTFVGQQYLKGEPGATLTIKVIYLVKSNPYFYFKINSTEYFLDNTFDITLDGTGKASFNVKLGGVVYYTHTEAENVRIQIIATDTGAIGTPDIQQYTKITG